MCCYVEEELPVGVYVGLGIFGFGLIVIALIGSIIQFCCKKERRTREINRYELA